MVEVGFLYGALVTVKVVIISLSLTVEFRRSRNITQPRVGEGEGVSVMIETQRELVGSSINSHKSGQKTLVSLNERSQQIVRQTPSPK
jgi:hypothetical protein